VQDALLLLLLLLVLCWAKGLSCARRCCCWSLPHSATSSKLSTRTTDATQDLTGRGAAGTGVVQSLVLLLPSAQAAWPGVNLLLVACLPWLDDRGVLTEPCRLMLLLSPLVLVLTRWQRDTVASALVGGAGCLLPRKMTLNMGPSEDFHLLLLLAGGVAAEGGPVLSVAAWPERTGLGCWWAASLDCEADAGLPEGFMGVVVC
jgi:hypothetical protein